MKELAIPGFAKAALRRARSLVVVPLLLFLQISFPQSAFAIGVGATDIESSLGENLRILIPIFSVENPDSLVVKVTTQMYGDDPERVLNASLERLNGQLTVVVSSGWSMVEPYVQFDLSLQDGKIVQQKNIVVLLEYHSGVSGTDSLRDGESAAGMQISHAPQGNQVLVTHTTRPQSVISGSIMGPYDEAQPGQIPEKFGAVLNGQSLWRVARKINRAMGVSIEQMTVALHEANPEAFLTGSVDSLAAGSYLIIPPAEFVKRINQNEAKQRLGLSTDAVVVAMQTDAYETSDRIVIENASSGNDLNSTSSGALGSDSVVQNNPFMVGGVDAEPEDDLNLLIGESVTALSENNPVFDAVETDITVIQSLSQTVGELMRDSIDREQSIQSLEARLSLFETLVESGRLAVLEAPLSVRGQRSQLNQGIIDSGLAAPLTPLEGNLNRWFWFASFALLLALGLFFRGQSGAKGRTEKLFSRLETEQVDKIVAAKKADEEPTKTGFAEKNSNADYPAFESNKSQRTLEGGENDEVEGVSYHEFDDELMVDEEGDDFEITSVTTVDTPSVTLEVPNKSFLFEAGNVAVFPRERDLTPQKKKEIIKDLDELIAEERFDEVRDLLDMFRGKQLDEANYHFQRLRLLLEEGDEHGFYEYFNMVENKFQDVDGDLKMDLANLVSRLNQI